MAALTIIRGSTLPSGNKIPSDIKDYLHFLNQNFHLASSGFYMQYQALNNAIRATCAVVYALTLVGGANINNTEFPETERFTPLLFAIDKENYTLTHKLLTYGANPNIVCPMTKVTPLAFAAQKGNLALVRLLLSFKADLEQNSKIDGGSRS